MAQSSWIQIENHVTNKQSRGLSKTLELIFPTRKGRLGPRKSTSRRAIGRKKAFTSWRDQQWSPISTEEVPQNQETHLVFHVFFSLKSTTVVSCGVLWCPVSFPQRKHPPGQMCGSFCSPKKRQQWDLWKYEANVIRQSLATLTSASFLGVPPEIMFLGDRLPRLSAF